MTFTCSMCRCICKGIYCTPCLDRIKLFDAYGLEPERGRNVETVIFEYDEV